MGHGMTPEGAVDMLSMKAAAAVAVGVSIMDLFLTGGAPVPFFNVRISTLGMAAAGSMLAFAYGAPVETRRKLYGYAIGGTFIGVWTVQILPQWLGWGWYVEDYMEPPLAGVTALISRWAVPFVIEHIPALWKRVFNTGGSCDG